jgi:hypothetical protein
MVPNRRRLGMMFHPQGDVRVKRIRPPKYRAASRKSVREQKIDAALKTAMRQARGEKPEEETKLKNPAMAVALLQAGVSAPPEPKPQLPNSAEVNDKPIASHPKGRNKAPLAVVRLSPKRRRKLNLTDEEKAGAKLAAEKKRKAKETTKRKAAAHRRAIVAEATRRDSERRETDRLASIESFLRHIEINPFTDLLAGWRKHVELVDYIRRTGKNRHRLELYERLVSCIEMEWDRRSKLRHTIGEYFDWPTTTAKRGNGTIGDLSWVEEGVLGYLGYHVGEKSTLTAANRHAILRRIFRMHLPPIESPGYLKEWSKPESAARLKKMADSIASFARQAKRQSSRDMSEAIDSWEFDLKMLHDEYYVGKFGFGWPAS